MHDDRPTDPRSVPAPVAPEAGPTDDAEPLEAERRPHGAARTEASPTLHRGPVALAWLVAIGADILQWVLLPFFFAGAASPWSTGLDVIVALVLLRTVGWHWAFLPTAIAELIPFVDLVPTWTLAMFIATRGRRKA